MVGASTFCLFRSAFGVPSECLRSAFGVPSECFGVLRSASECFGVLRSASDWLVAHREGAASDCF